MWLLKAFDRLILPDLVSLKRLVALRFDFALIFPVANVVFSFMLRLDGKESGHNDFGRLEYICSLGFEPLYSL